MTTKNPHNTNPQYLKHLGILIAKSILSYYWKRQSQFTCENCILHILILLFLCMYVYVMQYVCAFERKNIHLNFNFNYFFKHLFDTMCFLNNWLMTCDLILLSVNFYKVRIEYFKLFLYVICHIWNLIFKYTMLYIIC